jgi:hypothetical protein
MKARRLMGELQAWPHGDGRVWSVQSGSDPSEVYHVYRYTVQINPKSRWWVNTFCTCPAGEKHLVCYHRALVYLYSSGEVEYTVF